jgi:hypothetical protein
VHGASPRQARQCVAGLPVRQVVMFDRNARHISTEITSHIGGDAGRRRLSRAAC